MLDLPALPLLSRHPARLNIMSTADLGRFSSPATNSHAAADVNVWSTVRSLFRPLASLRLTVLLFALSLFLVLAGTVAQVDHAIWYVVKNYFRAWVAWIDFQIFFPRDWQVPGGTWFPGGWLIGGFMGVNLLSAHALRFKVTGKGRELVIGVVLLVAGMVMTWLAVQSGLDDTVESQLSPQFCSGLWHALRFALGAATLSLGYVLALNYQKLVPSGAAWLWYLGAALCALLLGISGWLFTHPEAKLDAAGLRILWQLIKCTIPALVLLAGCFWTFGRRAGIVLLHGGIGLLMFSELWTGLHAEEAQMQIMEGETVSHAVDNRSAELAFIDKSDAEHDRVTTVPLDMLLKAYATNQVFDDPALPFQVKVVEHQQNSSIRARQPVDMAPATRGSGLLQMSESQPINTGVGTLQGVDVPSIYAELISKEKSQQSLGVYLLSPHMLKEPVELEGKPGEVALRFKHIPKTYSVKLLDFDFTRYVGTNTPKNFSSEVVLNDPTQNVEDLGFTISMNNPLRFSGDTLYQASWDEKTERGTVLQVMTNSGWMIPYASCMLVATGMLAQFVSTFRRFVRGQTTPQAVASGGSVRELLVNWKSPQVWVPTLCLVIFMGYVFGRARLPKVPVAEMQIHKFGQLPVAYNGRVKPLDTLARNTLTVMSGRGSLSDKPAIAWLLDLVTDSQASREQPVFRIENLDVLEALGLKPREGYRYSLVEVLSKTAEFVDERGEAVEGYVVSRQAMLASRVAPDSRNLTQVKFLKLGNKLLLYRKLRDAFSAPAIKIDSREQLVESFQEVRQLIAGLKLGAARVVPPAQAGESWATLLEAEHDALLQQFNKKEINAATPTLRKILTAYAEGDVQQFNSEVTAYQKIITERAAAEQGYDAGLATAGTKPRKTSEKLSAERLEFESFFNHFNPFTKAMALYLVAFVLAACAWLGWNVVLNRSANWLLWFAFLLHSYALICRIYISGRPPVTNLYSSAVFIGWGAVLFALVFERIYRFGVGNLLAALVGFPTLYVAYNLAGDGDTFEVMRAVLDTQFWLATHVVCITLGYSTTLLSGALGLVYVLMSHVGSRLDREQQKHLTRMTYGTICFAMFFSFVGTVLGGLWGDDSWGRFWGWDPKENGALMIVLWNALVLHARWGGMIRGRGLAILATFGNVVTAWSWFGTNQLGVGLHAYGFRKGMTLWLCLFVASQLLVMLLGCLPPGWWRSKGDGQPFTQNA